MVARRVTGEPPLSMVAVTVSAPLFCARVSRSAPGDASDAGSAAWVAAISPTVHWMRMGAPAARPASFGVTVIVLRPSQVAGASSVNSGSGIASRIAIGTVFVSRPSARTTVHSSAACASPETRPASTVQESRSVATTSRDSPRTSVHTIRCAPPIRARTVARAPSSSASDAASSVNASPAATIGPTAVCSGFWFSYSSRTQSAERATPAMRTSSTAPTKL